MEILKQTKLTRAEWDSIEVPVSEEERDTLRLIIAGYENPQIKHNKKTSLFSFIKIDISDEIELFLYNKYFDPVVQKMLTKYGKEIILPENKSAALKKLKSIDALRLQNLDTNIQRSGSSIYEFLLLEFTEELLKNIGKGKTKYAFYLYTLIQLKKNSIRNVNRHVVEFVDTVIEYINHRVNIIDIIEQAYEFIEKNKYLLEFQDKELFSHQKDLFTVFRTNPQDIHKKMIPKLILYTAPTGTGKTLSPLGLASEYRVIFVCVARHIGLALAKSAVSMEKKIAFAFGAETASDIRLHYFAAVDFTKDKRSGGIRKVDNSNGVKVEMMICDAQSYLTAMHYMLAFNPKERIITYWDEPTISMDYVEHNLHEILHRNWSQNQIPNMVLSCATLPREDEIYDTIADFRCKFEDAEVHSITSYDCRKSIPIVTTDGYCALPHTLYSDFRELQGCIEYCESNKTVLRYFDLKEAVRFIFYVNQLTDSNDSILPELYLLNNYFGKISDITMNSLKIYYLEVLKRIPQEKWTEIYQYMNSTKKYKFERPVISKTSSLDVGYNNKTTGGGSLRRTASICTESANKSIPSTTSTSNTPVSASIKITTEDAYTLTDGPTIFLTEDVAKIAHFYIQQTAIPPEIFQNILRKITKNKDLSEKITALERFLEDTDKSTASKTGGDNSKKESKAADPDSMNSSKDPELKKKYKELDDLRAQIHFISLDTVYIPNTTPHQVKWSPLVSSQEKVSSAAFVPTIEEQVVRDIMSIDIENYQKVLLLMGIGLFMEDLNPKYLEIMKTMAYEQQLFMIIASSDYIYGTNYSFCHGFIGKDLANMTQQKTLQSLGRIGRVSIQQTYTVRFRDDNMIRNLFRKQTENLEAVNMSKIFTSDM